MDRNPLRPSTQEAIGERVRSLAIEAGARPRTHGFTRMFPDLTGPAHVLPDGVATRDRLLALAAAMAERADGASPPRCRSDGDSDLPAAYTYLLQFVLNDMVWARQAGASPEQPAWEMGWSLDIDALVNRRSGRLDLDSLYDAPRDPADVRRMLVGMVSPAQVGLQRTPRKAEANDLPRHARSLAPERDRQVRMGDTRNDEMLIPSQLHVAFLKAHNTLVDGGLSFQEARAALRRRYRWMVLNDLLPRLCDPKVLASLAATPHEGWAAQRSTEIAVPVEFAAAAFALVPTMARASYDYNENFRNIERAILSTRHALGGAGRGGEGLPAHWIIAWEGFLPLEAMAPQRARSIDTQLAGSCDAAEAQARHLLLKGYALGLPVGQAVAARLGLPALRGEALLACLPPGQRAAAAPFAEATPLWFYILAEASDPAGPAGAHLGPVGSHIVAETLLTMARQSQLGAGQDEGAQSEKEPAFERFTLCDLVLLAADQDLFSA